MRRFPRFEHRSEPLLPRGAFMQRLVRCGAMATALVAGIVLAPIAHRLLHRFHIEGRP